MGRKNKHTLSVAEREAFVRLRELHDELEKMRDGLRELKLLVKSVSSPNMDGMPKAQGTSDAYAQALVRIERQEREIAAQARRVNRAKAIPIQALKRFVGPFKTFCKGYYIDGVPFFMAQAESGVGERQCKNYMAYISSEQKKASP